MTNRVDVHYAGAGDLTRKIADALQSAGKDLENLGTGDLAALDEFHIRGRKATLELADRMQIGEGSHVIDIGSGLGGPARTLAEVYGCRVTGLDLTENFCKAATTMAKWTGLDHKVTFEQGDATDIPHGDDTFDAAMTIHVAMNIPAKDAVYAHAKRVLKPNCVFAVYDVLQGEGGPVRFPVPWAREPSISHLATPEEMRDLLTNAGFQIIDEVDSTVDSLAWFEEMMARMKQTGPPPVTFQAFLGDDFPQMARNQVLNLAERRIRTVSYFCRA